MKSRAGILITGLCLLFALAARAKGEIVYTQVNVSIPINQSYNIDLNHDGVTDFTLSSRLLQLYCQFGTGDVWHTAVQPGQSNGGMVSSGQSPVALKIGVRVDSTQVFYGGWGLMSEFAYGLCGDYVLGNWLNLPDRYLGFEFQIQGNRGPDIHYGWAKVSVAGYLDQHHNLQTVMFLSGFAYETVPGQAIMTGQTSDGEDAPTISTAPKRQ